MSDRTGDAIETLEYVLRSPSRVRVLETLREEGAVSKEVLKAEVDVVRTTLQRTLTGLAERGLIRERERRYELTSAGTLATAGVETALERVGAAVRLRPVLEQLPGEALEFDLTRLDDATVVESTTVNPYAPVEHHAASLADADRARLLLPTISAKPIETARDAIESGAVFELIVTESVAETLRTGSPTAEAFAPVTATDAITVSVTDDVVPFYLGIVDAAVQIGVTDDSGLPTALLESTDAALRTWAIDRFDAFDRRSTAVEFGR
ncbi:helix-turn-helix transcriptional regulator [Natrinema salaciae]|uniref:Predicted transcriptional regulator, contains HTH domain n=1 Tax=Natrinema salaciae TaxID=1186196 RepID=A0A1H9B1H0_9EURY|nr:transcriptional regulator [Natrinema salaciae]SEP82675.1 Predicted transcriptional regulator, contains HTH domain [Natrinema salaciae]